MSSRADIYQTRIYGSADPIIVDLIPRRSRVLDIGCGTGQLGFVLTVEKECEVDGLDISAQAIAEARERLHRAVVSDVETEPVPFSEKFDWAILADVLEHTYDPVAVLEKARGSLKPGGRLLVAVPNVVCWEVRKSVLLGRFNYSDRGVLDWTHIRFFTLQTLQDTLRRAGYSVESVRIEPVWIRFFSRRLPALAMWVADHWRTLLAKRFVAVAKAV